VSSGKKEWDWIRLDRPLTGGSMLMTGRCRRSRRPSEFSGVMLQSAGGRHAITASEKGSHGMLCSCSST
jgi:hypothetical protein